MNTITKIALLAGGTVAIGTVALIIAKQLNNAGKYLLQIQASDGGTTNPSPSPSGIYKNPGEVITIRAIPSSGYTVGTWILDGAEIGNQETIQVTMNMNHAVVVTFWEGGQPPPSYPVAITNVGSAQVFGHYAARFTSGLCEVNYTDSDFNWGGIAEYQMKFKVIDARGQGVPNISVALYPDLFPDTGKYSGYLILNQQQATNTNPLISTSDENGFVSVNMSYWYGLFDEFRKLCDDAELYFWYWLILVPAGLDIFNGSRVPTGGVEYSRGGEGVTGQTDKMGPLILNTVIAKVKDTSIPEARGLAYCGLHIKML